jgi:methionine synthase II (cobalamin-independent)
MTESPAAPLPPFRADHVGSLLRPPELLRARDDFAAGQIGADDLRSIEDAAIREVVRRQAEAGLRASPGTWSSFTSSAASARFKTTRSG